MKRSLGLGATALLLAGYTFAVPGSGQGNQTPKVDLNKMKVTVDLLHTPVTLDLFETPLNDVLMLVEDYSQLKFGLDYETFPGEKTVNFSASNEPLGESLQKILDVIGWTYALKPDGDLLLRPVPKSPNKTVNTQDPAKE